MEDINVENLGLTDLGKFVQFAGCTICENKKCYPGDVLAYGNKVLHPGILCPHVEVEAFKSFKIINGYVAFWGGFLSNFYPCKIYNDLGYEFRSSEQYFMWLKAVFFNDDKTANEILEASTPKKAKALGRKVRDFDESKWEKYRESAMFTAVYEKFNQNKNIQDYLLSPVFDGMEFVEGSPIDHIWGVGISWDDPDIADKKNWKGLNLLGKTINKVREKLR